MDNVILMAIVNAGQYLPHEDASISLSELTAVHNLVEEFPAFAELSHNIVSLFILEELVYFKDVRVVDAPQISNLVKKHLLLNAIHP